MVKVEVRPYTVTLCFVLFMAGQLRGRRASPLAGGPTTVTVAAEGVVPVVDGPEDVVPDALGEVAAVNFVFLTDRVVRDLLLCLLNGDGSPYAATHCRPYNHDNQDDDEPKCCAS